MGDVGLNKLDVIAIFRRTLADRVTADPLVNSIARAVGEVIEENNRKLLEHILGKLERVKQS